MTIRRLIAGVLPYAIVRAVQRRRAQARLTAHRAEWACATHDGTPGPAFVAIPGGRQGLGDRHRWRPWWCCDRAGSRGRQG